MTVHRTSSRHSRSIHQGPNLGSNLYVAYVYPGSLFGTEGDYIAGPVVLIFPVKNIDVE
jgi:hypothetical protein